MKTHNSFIKVRYAETDQMGIVHHGNYPQYLEIARLEWLDGLGISYKSMEENGVFLPVYSLNIIYKKSAQFDDLLTVAVTLRNLPTVRIIFDYKIYNQHDELLTTASTELIFMDAKKNRPIRCPAYILDKLQD
ncbi:thioesterase family protein [uncultured Dokdonia sp.]|uniref:acyl-CoA thioesterase n=1 Tax=uncultured Dokdonia sp. TaxID=575653 RepID=UPI00262E2F56|nr:thioesterase family protein [uncultured Dokdonia sp.]